MFQLAGSAIGQMDGISGADLELIPWSFVHCNRKELRLDISLNCGQSFRWKPYNGNQWIGVIRNYVWILAQNDENVMYKVIGTGNNFKSMEPRKKKSKVESPREEYYRDLLHDYFQLNHKLSNLYKQWCEVDEHFSKMFHHVQGVRVLRQDPVETLFAFICSSNNNISRITSMVENLCRHFGEKITEINGESYFGFPTIERLSEESVYETLKDLRFGYRAKFINESAKYLNKHGDQYLYELRSKPYEEAKKELMKIPGVGAKVADCICLMSLDKLEAVPVDTHVLQIAERDYKFKISTKSLTDASYKKIAKFFRDLWGPYAGWAQSIAFSSDLKKFKPLAEKKN